MKIQEFKRETELFKINENTIGNTTELMRKVNASKR